VKFHFLDLVFNRENTWIHYGKSQDSKLVF